MCPKCTTSKTTDDFYKKHGWCKACDIAQSKRYRELHLDQSRESQRRFEATPARKAYRRKRYINNFEFELIRGAKRRAKAKGIPCSISIKDIVIPEYCPILGLKLKASDGCMSDDSPTLDRIRPELGYISGNVQVVSFLANRMKSNANEEQLRKFSKWVETTYGEKTVKLQENA